MPKYYTKRVGKKDLKIDCTDWVCARCCGRKVVDMIAQGLITRGRCPHCSTAELWKKGLPTSLVDKE